MHIRRHGNEIISWFHCCVLSDTWVTDTDVFYHIIQIFLARLHSWLLYITAANTYSLLKLCHISLSNMFYQNPDFFSIKLFSSCSTACCLLNLGLTINKIIPFYREFSWSYTEKLATGKKPIGLRFLAATLI